MTVSIVLRCSGCGAGPAEAGFLRREFCSFTGKDYGFGTYQTRVDLQPPEGWVPFDPWTQATYCPDCWASILEPDEKVSIEEPPDDQPADP